MKICPSLRSFVLPGGTEINSILHVCRTVCRRAERLCVTLARQDSAPGFCVQYLNRLSDAFFVWSRWANAQLGAGEVLWKPNEAASGRTGKNKINFAASASSVWRPSCVRVSQSSRLLLPVSCNRTRTIEPQRSPARESLRSCSKRRPTDLRGHR